MLAWLNCAEANLQIHRYKISADTWKDMETQIHIVPICKYTLDTHFDRTQKYKVCSVPICEYTEQKSWVWPYLIQFARNSARIKSRDRFQNIEMHNNAFQNNFINLNKQYEYKIFTVNKQK